MIQNLAVKNQKIKSFNCNRNNLKTIGKSNNQHQENISVYQSQQCSQFVPFDMKHIISTTEQDEKINKMLHVQSFTHFRSSSNVGHPCLTNLKSLKQQRNRKKLLKMISSPKPESQTKSIRSQMIENIKFLQQHYYNQTLRKQCSKDLKRSSTMRINQSIVSDNFNTANKSRKRAKISIVSCSRNDYIKQNQPIKTLQQSNHSINSINLTNQFNNCKSNKISVCSFIKYAQPALNHKKRRQQNSFDIIALSYQQNKQNLRKKKKGIQLIARISSVPQNNYKNVAINQKVRIR